MAREPKEPINYADMANKMLAALGVVRQPTRPLVPGIGAQRPLPIARTSSAVKKSKRIKKY